MSNEKALVNGFCRDSYAAYCYHVHRGKWTDSRFHTFLANLVQDFVEADTGHPYDILVLSTPPQHGKSMTVTETLPSWYVGKHPDSRCIVGCYNSDFAAAFGRRNRQKITEFGGEIFGISVAKHTDRDIDIQGHRGGIMARGLLAGITGNPGHLIIIDDPIKNRAEADSKVIRDKLWEEWYNSIKTRTHPGAKIIVIQTRWHEDDLAGRLIRDEQFVTVVNVPLEAEKGDILGRKVGDALCPEIGKDNEWLKSFKAGYTDGSRAWNALYQGKPSSEKGNLFKRGWWKFYDVLPEKIPLKVISVDATFKNADTSDFVAIEVWGKKDADYYLIDLIKKRMDFPETLAAIKTMNEKYPDRHSVLIEDKANGSAIISTLRRTISGVIPVQPEGGKEARANAVTGIVEAGNVYLPKFGAFTDDFIEECASFPLGTHDDMVDAMTQFLNRFAFISTHKEKPMETEADKLKKLKERTLREARRKGR